MRAENNLLVKVRNISKKYNVQEADFFALKNISFDLHKGQSIGLIGANGSGKTTLLKIIAEIIKPSDGEIEINGKINSLIEIGSNFIDELTGIENIKHYLELHNTPKQLFESKMKEAIAFSELGNQIYQQIKYYSSGMFVRLAISVGFQIDADIFLMDEVLMTGDAKFRDKSEKKFKEVMNSGAAVILASHNPTEIVENCSYCIWLEKGDLLMFDKTQSVISKYYLEKAKPYINKKDEVLKYFTNKSFTEYSANDKGIEAITSNDFVKVKEFSILNANTIDEKIEINICFENLDKGIVLHPLIKIFNVFNNTLIASVSSNDSNFYKNIKERKEVCFFKIKCSIPIHFLGEGVYYLGLSFVNPPDSEKEDLYQMFELSHKIQFRVNHPNQIDYSRNSFEVFIKPKSNWVIL